MKRNLWIGLSNAMIKTTLRDIKRNKFINDIKKELNLSDENVNKVKRLINKYFIGDY